MSRAVMVLFSFGLAMVGITLALATPSIAGVNVVVSALSYLLYLTSGLVALWLRPNNRLGLLLLLDGFSLWLSDLSRLHQPFLQLIGSITHSLPLALTVHLLLAFPTGVVPGRVARWVVGVGYFVSTVLEVPKYLIGAGRFSIFPRVPHFVVGLTSWIQSAIGVSSVVATAVIVVIASAHAGSEQRSVLGPLRWYRIVCPLLIGVTAIGLTAARGTTLAAWLSTGQATILLLLPVVFLFGLLRGSFGRATDVRDMVVRIGQATPTSGDLTASVASALGDPHAIVLYRRGAAYIDEWGAILAEPRPAADRRLLHPVRYDGVLVGAIVYDGTMLARNAGVDVIGSLVAMSIEKQRIADEQQLTLAHLRVREEALRNSRLRLVQAADTERRRIARDLHDGAQQHLVVLGMTARKLSRRIPDQEIARCINSLADGLTDLNAEFRRMVAGIMPESLMQGGLAAAIDGLAERMPVPTRVQISGIPDGLPAESESTVYFTVAEALANAVKHAQAQSIEVTVEHVSGNLITTITDDGIGFADPSRGTGLTGLADRIGALGGTISIRSDAGQGTRLRAEVPCGRAELTSF
ncbi:sensor histidine kinase [Nakamurella sp. PAMC28650]|uniref:sensor histidine kinase n=1 Tax=Nakamurella sp. PAMC28650 TaxID=2762325 RepID=UPI00164E1CBD|nr:histidine kinase [Nakamurella sp. PAMC28650]QNK82113.1 hypothetical protein H7F38_04975 [Nakamurella sp. PAMC28650]